MNGQRGTGGRGEDADLNSQVPSTESPLPPPWPHTHTNTHTHTQTTPTTRTIYISMPTNFMLVYRTNGTT